MFRWLPIVWANLKRRKLRLVFTFVSILLAFLMFGMLDALRTSLAGVVNVIGADRPIDKARGPYNNGGLFGRAARLTPSRGPDRD